MRRLIAALTITGLTAVGAVAIAPTADARAIPPQAVNGAKTVKTLKSAINSLKVATETPSGYARSKFKLWDDYDGDCKNTRAEVLASESKKKTTGSCTIKTGKWVSLYDGKTYTKASSLDIDHLVPLEEAWASGAKSWPASKREAYANDLADSRDLIAVSLSANRSKGDREPDQWMPAKARCTYIVDWVAVKYRWKLTIDKKEKTNLLSWASKCGNPKLSLHRAVVKAGSGSSDTTGGSSGGSSSGLDPRFATCTAAKAAGYGPYYNGKDPEYAWYEDRDGDGVVCE